MFPSCCAISSIEKVVEGQKSWQPSKGRLRLRKGQILQSTESWVWVNAGAQHSWYQEWAVHGRVPLHPSGHPYHQHSRYSSVFYHYISDLAMSSQTDVSSKFQLSNSQSRVNKILLAAFLHPGSVHEISWLDHFTAALEVLQLITQIFTSSEGETKGIRPKSEKLCFFQPLPVGVWQAETTECEDSTVYSTGRH